MLYETNHVFIAADIKIIADLTLFQDLVVTVHIC